MGIRQGVGTYLLMILPRGVVSKNDMGACSILMSRLLCRDLDAAAQPTAAASNTTQIVTAENILEETDATLKSEQTPLWLILTYERFLFTYCHWITPAYAIKICRKLQANKKSHAGKD